MTGQQHTDNLSMTSQHLTMTQDEAVTSHRYNTDIKGQLNINMNNNSNTKTIFFF